MAIKVLCLCCLYFMCNIGGSIEQESSEDFYRVVNMFTGICWQSITAEAGIIYTRHLEFGINMMVNLNCKVTIMAPFDGQRVVLNFAAFDIHESEGCTSDKVLVYDGDNIQSELLTPLEGLCGDSAPESFNSSGNSLTIRFVTDHNDTYEFQQKGGFVAYFTAFIPESDDTSVILDDLLPEDWNDQYCCRVGGMCIPIKYTCDGFKNCADNSDEELSKCTEGGNILDILSELTGLSRGTIIGLIILMLLVVLLVLLAIIYYCCCRDKRKVKRKLTKKNYIAQDEYEYDDYQYPFAAAPYEFYYNRNGTDDDIMMEQGEEPGQYPPSLSNGHERSQDTLFAGSTIPSAAFPILADKPHKVGDAEKNIGVYGLSPGTGQRRRRRKLKVVDSHIRGATSSESVISQKTRKQKLPKGSPMILPRTRALPVLERRRSFGGVESFVRGGSVERLRTRTNAIQDTGHWWTAMPPPSMSRFHSDSRLIELNETRTKPQHTANDTVTPIPRASSEIDVNGAAKIVKGRKLKSLALSHRWLGPTGGSNMSLRVGVKSAEIVKLDGKRTEVMKHDKEVEK